MELLITAIANLLATDGALLGAGILQAIFQYELVVQRGTAYAVDAVASS